jgi:hypothetical protein
MVWSSGVISKISEMPLRCGTSSTHGQRESSISLSWQRPSFISNVLSRSRRGSRTKSDMGTPPNKVEAQL